MDGRHSHESRPLRQFHNRVVPDPEPLREYEPPQYFFGDERKRLEWYRTNRPNQAGSLLPNANTVGEMRVFIRSHPCGINTSNDTQRFLNHSADDAEDANEERSNHSAGFNEISSIHNMNNASTLHQSSVDISMSQLPKQYSDHIKARAMALTVNEFHSSILNKKTKYEKKKEDNNVMKFLKKLPIPAVFADNDGPK